MADFELKIFNVNISQELTGSLHYLEIYPSSYGIMTKEAVVCFLAEFDVDIFVHDTRQITTGMIVDELNAMNFKLTSKDKVVNIYRKV